MGKRTEKLIIYLDQNFLSDVSKVGAKEGVRPEFNDIYELLHQGFVDEKLVVPGSILHDIESSLATHLKDRISTSQGSLGQVRLYRPDEIRNKQIFAALDRFIGNTPEDPLRPEAAFMESPDPKVERLGISVDSHLERRNFRAARHREAQQLEALRQNLLKHKTTYETQLKAERAAQREEFIQTYAGFSGSIPADKLRELTTFTESADFEGIPLLHIEAHLLASILTRKPDRRVRSGDRTDIDALSAYTPYMDVVCTDAFMSEQMRGFAKEYDVRFFHAKNGSLRELKAFLASYLASAQPVRRPSITAFVLPPRERREESFRFFRQLGSALRAMGTLEYGELYAFDDGAMPKYELPQLPGKPLSSYGLQDVTAIPLPSGVTEVQILKMCSERCRSDHFVVIDEYREINDTFMLVASMRAEANMETTDGYRIIKK